MGKVWNAVVVYIKRADKWLFLLLLVICGFGLTVVAGVTNTFSASSGQMLFVQGIAMALGFGIAIFISVFDYRSLARLWKLYMPAVLALVALTFVIGAQRSGADDRAWILLPGGMSIQPSEFLKIAFILTFSLHIQKVGNKLNRPLHMLLLCLHGAAPVLLIHFQGDDGSALVFFVIFAIVLFCAGVKWQYMLIGGAGVAAAIPLAWLYVLNDDQKQRILALVNPGTDPLGIEMQQSSARVAIGSGQWFGSGLFTGTHSYIPEIQNDFIFSFIGQALGFVGCLAVLVLLLLLGVKILLVVRVATDALGRCICVGVFAMIAAQAVLNVGMNVSLLPVVGVTLPFFSAGGSSMVTLFAGLGLVMSVYTHNDVGMFEGSSPVLRSR